VQTSRKVWGGGGCFGVGVVCRRDDTGMAVCGVRGVVLEHRNRLLMCYFAGLAL
jgi:hypothetical protein